MSDVVENWGYGFRIDGTPKGPGFAAQRLPDGSVMTEFSLGRPDFLYQARRKTSPFRGRMSSKGSHLSGCHLMVRPEQCGLERHINRF